MNNTPADIDLCVHGWIAHRCAKCFEAEMGEAAQPDDLPFEACDDAVIDASEPPNDPDAATWTELIKWELQATDAISDLTRLRDAAQAVLDLDDTKDGYHELEMLRAVVKETEEKWRKP